MKNKKQKYLIQCKCCGHLLFKTNTALFFDTEMKCANCKKIIQIPKDVVITLDREFGLAKIK